MNTTETDRVQCSVPRRYPTLKLVFSSGICSRTVSLRPDVTYLGREVSDGAGLCLPNDKQASRQHASIQAASLLSDAGQPAVRILDLSSKNGLFVNGERVESAVLSDGDVIRIGNSLMLLRIESAELCMAPHSTLLGQSPAMREVYGKLVKAARAQTMVLLVGETGTGKDACAQVLHNLSERTGGPFVHVNTSAIPESLAEGQLFGHKKGAFTGAKDDFIGLFRQADRGTLFLNEIGDMALPLQAKLLSAIERKEVLPVGSTRPVSCDTWFIAATNQDLRAMVRRGLFREDLLERLKGTLIRLPPLRNRQEDVFPILQHAIRKQGVKRDVELTARLAEAMLLYHWPGNVRELLHLAQAMAPDVAEGAVLDLVHVEDRFLFQDSDFDRKGRAVQEGNAEFVPPAPLPSTGATASQERAVAPRLSAEALARLWDESGHNVSQFAAKVQRSRRQARRWLDELGLRRKA